MGLVEPIAALRVRKPMTFRGPPTLLVSSFAGFVALFIGAGCGSGTSADGSSGSGGSGGSSTGGAGSSNGHGTGVTVGVGGGGGMPPQLCSPPAEAAPADVTHPTTKIGDGTAPSCTAAAFDAAVQAGGVVTFDCGPDPVTINLPQQVRINNTAGADGLGDTVIDGGGKVTLNGGGASRVLYLDACEPPYNSPHCDTFDHPRLTVQNLTFTGGSVSDPDKGGAAIFANGGVLKVVGSKFFNNHCAMTGQDVGGGAIATYLQSQPVFIVGSTFGGSGGKANSCSNGGAIASIGTSYSIFNSVIDGNEATGNGGNPGNGGNGGGIVNDGNTYTLSLCGVTVSNNHANAFGGAIFYVSNDHTGTTVIDQSTIHANVNPAGMETQPGGLFLLGTQIDITHTPID